MFSSSGIDYIHNLTSDYVIGRNTNINNVRLDLWEGPTAIYVFPTTPIQMSVISTSASDSANGTGIQKAHIHYLDTNYNQQTEVITLNGVSRVNTVATNILRVNGFHAIQVGTNADAVGNISLQNTGGTVTYSYIPAGYNYARQAIYTVPSGKTGYITQWAASTGAPTGSHFTQVDLRATAHYGVVYPGTFIVQDSICGTNFGLTVGFDIPIRIPATTDVKISVISDAANAGAACVARIDGWLE